MAVGGERSGGPAFPKRADTRALVKASGPRIRVSITGVGRRFDLGQLTTVVGAGVALMGIATAAVDVLLLYVLPKRARFGARRRCTARTTRTWCAAPRRRRGRRERRARNRNLTRRVTLWYASLCITIITLYDPGAVSRSDERRTR